MKQQARQVMENIGAILDEGGGAFDSVLRVDCIVTDLGLMKEFNTVYREYFPDALPARMAYEVSRIAGGALVEVAVIAAVRDE
jgi:2-iminobutanoate/2-iminopropanoate deaminase